MSSGQVSAGGLVSSTVTVKVQVAVLPLESVAVQVTVVTPLGMVAKEVERIALEDDYFIEHKLYPNVDFYTGAIYEAMRFPVDMFPVLFAIGRTVGWLAQWQEMLMDSDQAIARPRQIYTGYDQRPYVTMEDREATPKAAEVPVGA